MKRLLAVVALCVASLHAQVAVQAGQTISTQLNPATTTTSQGGVVTNPSSNFIINVTAGPIVCPGNDLQYMSPAALTLPASSTNVLVWNCQTQPSLYAKQAVTAAGTGSTAGTPATLAYPIPGVEIALATVVCNATACGNGGNGSITDSRSAANFPIVTDWFEFVPAPGNCVGTVSGNSTGTNGITSQGSIAVVQDQTSVTGTNTHNYFCHIPLPSKTTANKGVVNVLDATFLYGVQTTALGTQVATLSSGTLNSVAVFQSFTAPAAGASETQSAAMARADSGSSVFTPAVASFNTGTTTAGQFFSEKFAPGSVLSLNTDLTDLTLNVALLNTATSATITQTPGFFVHYAFIPF